MTENVQTIGGFDRDQEDADIQREKVVNTGEPRRVGGSVFDQLRTKFKNLDSDRTQIFKVQLRNGDFVWLELDTDLSEDDTESYREQSRKGKRESSRNGGDGVSQAMFSAAAVNDKNTRIWFDDPEDGGKPVLDSEGDPLTVHSSEWLQALGFEPTQPLEGLREAFTDWRLVELYASYYAIAAGEGVQAVNPTRVKSGD